MKNSVHIDLPDEVYNTATGLAGLSKLPIEEVLTKVFQLGVPLFEVLLLSNSGFPLRGTNETASSFEKRLRQHISGPLDFKALVLQREASILLAYIQFLESYDGHPQRFFFRDPEIGRVIATPETIEQLKQNASDVYKAMAHDVACAERQWVARWLCNTEDVAVGRKKGSFDALKWLMERDHGWQIKTEAQPDLDRLKFLFRGLLPEESHGE